MTRFGEVLEAIKRKAGSWRAMELMMLQRTGEKYSYQHFINLARGTSTPTYEMARKIARGYPEFASDLFEALDAPVPSEFTSSDTLPIPAGARLISEDGQGLPVGPAVSAEDSSWIGDLGALDTLDLNAIARDRGADYLVEVAGDCLEPHISRGDWVAVKRSRTAQNGQVVVAQVMEDGFRGELGDALTLKVYRTAGPHGKGYYRADGTIAHHALEARIVGKVVAQVRRKPPSFK